MTHWGWYWKIKKKHTPKPLCSQFMALDSFSMFKIKQAIDWCLNKVVLEIPKFKLVATLLFSSFHVSCEMGEYNIQIERQPCNFGGCRYFFHCPRCNRRMRFLYCAFGVFICRKCLNAGYFSQRQLASRRNLCQMSKIEKRLLLQGGSINLKPKHMHRTTFWRLQNTHTDYQVKAEDTMYAELKSWYPKNKIWG